MTSRSDNTADQFINSGLLPLSGCVIFSSWIFFHITEPAGHVLFLSFTDTLFFSYSLSYFQLLLLLFFLKYDIDKISKVIALRSVYINAQVKSKIVKELSVNFNSFEIYLKDI